MIPQPDWFLEHSWPHRVRLVDIAIYFGVSHPFVLYQVNRRGMPRNTDKTFDLCAVQELFDNRAVIEWPTSESPAVQYDDDLDFAVGSQEA
jgi:hypothetical protein